MGYIIKQPYTAIFILIAFTVSNTSFSQSFYVTSNVDLLREVQLNTDCGPCDIQPIGPTPGGLSGISFSPDGMLYALTDGLLGWGIQQIDITTGDLTPIFTYSGSIPNMFGLLSVGGGIFYTLPWGSNNSDLVYRWDINAGTVTSIGGTGYNAYGEIAMQGGKIYLSTKTAVATLTIVQLDITNPSNSQSIVSFPLIDYLNGFTASPYCKTLIGTHVSTNELTFISLIDGAITPVCDLGQTFGHLVASTLEHAPEPDCIVHLDLDCDDSSGAVDADFNSPEFDCLSPGVPIADTDIKMFYDAIISTMTIQVIGNVPDAPFEIVDMIGSVQNINVMGDGTDMIILTNAGGAKSTDFKTALQQILYRNTAEYPTAGPRTVEVQFTTQSGMSSNIATAFIEVNELPLITLDLGPDQEICEGETATFDAGVPNAVYQWSTGQSSQSITVSNEGEYIVTVSNNFECPNKDTVFLDVLPIIHVSLTGDDQTCDNEAVNLTITSDAPFPIDVEITPDPGSTFTIPNITGSYSIIDVIGSNTGYEITGVITSEPACVELTDPNQFVEVLPTYDHSFEVNLCEGDSIWLGFYWETEAGVYENTLSTIDLCDSVVTTTINILPAVYLSLQSTTCDSASAGVFYQYLNNPAGCDTVIENTVTLLPSDTTYVLLASCNSANTGVSIDTLTNITGCDSLVITTVSLIPPEDTTVIVQLTCDSSMLGIVQELHTNQAGCDSLVLITTAIAPADTTYQYSTSCDPGQIGVSQTLFDNHQGCDSLVISTVTAGVPDTTYTSTTSCDSSSLGVFEEHFISQSGCDSIVFTAVTYSASDSTFINSSSCNVDDTGVFIESFINRFGCDSIVTETVSFLVSHNINLVSSSCNPADTGVFILNLINQFGCDSIITETVSLLPGDETFLFSTTCKSSEAGMFITTHLNQYGCDSIVTSTIALVAADTTLISLKTCFPNEVGSIESTFTSPDGCDSLVITETSLFPLPQLDVEVTSDFNGFDISCFGESDGSAMANVTGVGQFEYIWSTTSADQSITGLSAGAYGVTVTDANGCITEGSVILFDPPPFSISFIVSQPDCFDNNRGSITVEQTGGIASIRYSIDGINYQSSNTFTDLSGGTHEITAFDANDCEVKEIIWINVPLMVNVDLGDDQIILPGDTAIVNAIVNVPYDSLSSVVWTGLMNPNCPTCLTQPVAPIITTTYSVTVETIDGCTDEDAMTLYLLKDIDVYIPNIFSPNGDNINDRLVISAGDYVEKISSFIIYDRWGNMVFAANDFLPDDLNNAWDGRVEGKPVNPGVFAYKVIIDFKDGRSEIRYGNVTLVR